MNLKELKKLEGIYKEKTYAKLKFSDGMSGVARVYGISQNGVGFIWVDDEFREYSPYISVDISEILDIELLDESISGAGDIS